MDAGFNGTVELVTDAQINVYLTGLKSAAQKSILERLGFRDVEGNFLRGTSHQFRHWLSTLADETGFLGLEQARWMGRAKLSHNSAYDHVTPVERAREVRERTASRHGSEGPVTEIATRINDPIRRSEFIAATVPTAHVTDMGLCVHDWDAAPCPKHGSCALCDKIRIVKGKQEDRAAAVSELQDVEEMLQAARNESDMGTYGASNWIRSQLRRKLQLERIIAVHDDPARPDGMIVQLTKLSDAELDQYLNLQSERI
ncbi:hypothetical protein GCM10011515_08450 [Tsuneonella deserti]|uniref:Integrase n=2 Tax=Tsuneonella deserti TaxID=2035528 RepID=A0ABQ1S6E0_9SPHN|nr:hypothetical protein GCM10011515_08450 [Tsuneonella deserti]